MLAFLAASLAGLAWEGIGERAYRFYLEETGAVVTGEVVGHRLYRCRGIGCSRRVFVDGGYGSAAFEAVLERCLARPRSNCHTDLAVRFDFGGSPFVIEGQVSKRDFGKIAPGSRITVLVNRDHPEKSLLRDHNPDGFLFWVAIFVLVVAMLFGSIFLPRRKGWRRY